MQKMTINNANIRITENSYLIDTGELSTVDISVEAGVSFFYTFVPTQSGHYIRHIDIATGAFFYGGSIVSLDDTHLEITTSVTGDAVSSTLLLLSLATDDTTLFVEGKVVVDTPYRHVSTRVDQTNILIGKNARVRGIPKLEIATDDIVGGHSCKVHRLTGESLFYLESRGLSSTHAETMLLNSEILRHLEHIKNEEEKRQICFGIHERLKKQQ